MSEGDHKFRTRTQRTKHENVSTQLNDFVAQSRLHWIREDDS